MEKTFRFVRSNPIFWLLLAYCCALGGHLAYRTVTGAEELREARGFYLQHVIRMSRPLLKDGRARELSKYLRDAVSTGLIDFYELEHKGKLEAAGRGPASRPVLAEPVSEHDGWIWGRVEFSDETLKLASGFGWQARWDAAWTTARARFPSDILFLALACALTAFFQTTARKQSLRQGAENLVRKESKKAKVLRAEVARQSVGDSGDFSGVCGRSSLLNQVELAANGDNAKFFATLEEFYSDCSAHLSRYNGKLLAVHGHELLYFFQEGNSTQQARFALSAARDMEAIARARGFRLGTALAQGRLHGGELLSGFALFGEPVEETADCLQAIASAKESAIWVSENFAKNSSGHAEFKNPSSGARKLHARALVEISGDNSFLERARNGDSAEIAFHRGDSAIAELLQSLAEDSSWERESYVAAINELRQVQCRRCNSSVLESYRKLLASELLRKDSYRLSAVLALAARILDREQIDRALEKNFHQAIAIKDRRIRANGVELFTKFFPEREIPELRSLLRDEDNRVSSNALVKAACERFDEKVIARIEERVKGGSVAHVASALHAMGEIALYYRKHDPLFLGTKFSFLRLFDNMGAWASHPNTMIRRQALLAAQKLQSDPVNAKLREVFASTDDPELVGLFGSVYGWRKASSKAA